eukprot:CAMPEP_0174259632 /NCGR_PEP_ID=MMETSP0439-20130205/8436_1 /TAXON_ID=0 /ORGANISM="Stereomyxa ramosa, Strain Chinc5" /LENGTH=85 /DNA_ID=CAMNT_0015343599 /DNA_START=253 /DNA_END=507 /DNA_ORIENTATION=+
MFDNNACSGTPIDTINVTEGECVDTLGIGSIKWHCSDTQPDANPSQGQVLLDFFFPNDVCGRNPFNIIWKQKCGVCAKMPGMNTW